MWRQTLDRSFREGNSLRAGPGRLQLAPASRVPCDPSPPPRPASEAPCSPCGVEGRSDQVAPGHCRPALPATAAPPLCASRTQAWSSVTLPEFLENRFALAGAVWPPGRNGEGAQRGSSNESKRHIRSPHLKIPPQPFLPSWAVVSSHIVLCPSLRLDRLPLPLTLPPKLLSRREGCGPSLPPLTPAYTVQCKFGATDGHFSSEGPLGVERNTNCHLFLVSVPINLMNL